MPEAVLQFKETGSLQDVTDIHRSICFTYKDDFAKYAKSRELELLQKVFENIPRIIGQKVKYSNISREYRSSDIKTALMLLAKARICSPVYHSSCSGLPLHAESELLLFISCDPGIFGFLVNNTENNYKVFIQCSDRLQVQDKVFNSFSLSLY